MPDVNNPEIGSDDVIDRAARLLGHVTVDSTATAGSSSVYRLLSAATTNGNSIKGSAGNVYGWYITNTNSSPRFVKLYDKASAPTVGTDTPKLTLVIPGSTTGAGSNISINPPVPFTTGIAIAITGVVTDADTTAVALNEVVVNLFYA